MIFTYFENIVLHYSFALAIKSCHQVTFQFIIFCIIFVEIHQINLKLQILSTLFVVNVTERNLKKLEEKFQGQLKTLVKRWVNGSEVIEKNNA